MPHDVKLFSRIGVGSEVLAGDIPITAGKVVSIDETFTSESVTIASAIDVSALKAIYILSDADIGVVFNANEWIHDFGLTLFAGQPFTWHSTSGHPNPFLPDDVKSIVPFQTGESCRFQMKVITDPTP